MSSWAKPGVKCVCIDAFENRFTSPGQIWAETHFPLVEQRIYTIREIGQHRVTGHICVKLDELADRSDLDDGYAVERFRPLTTKTQEDDVALFRHLLNGTPAGVDA